MKQAVHAGAALVVIILTEAAVAKPPTTGPTLTTIANLGKAPSFDTQPAGSVIVTSNGVLYATTLNSAGKKKCPIGCGSAFSVSPVKGGKWKLATIENFTAALGNGPNGTLLADALGNLYGVTRWSDSRSGEPNGCGTAFELQPPLSGSKKWTAKTLIAFGPDGNSPSGCKPSGALVADDNGNLFGTTTSGGAQGEGTVYELSPPANGSSQWTEQVLWTFSGGSDGGLPQAGLVRDPQTGILYGTTVLGGNGGLGSGTVFALTPGGNGMWSESVIWSFTDINGDGTLPGAPVVLGPGGSLLGSTDAGGDCGRNGTDGSGSGIVFQLSPPTGGASAWTENVLYCLGTGGLSAITLDSTGNIFFPTSLGSSGEGPYIIRLSPEGGAYQATVVATFAHSKYGDGDDQLNGPLTPDASGNLFGTAGSGGLYSSLTDIGGTVFELTGSGYQP